MVFSILSAASVSFNDDLEFLSAKENNKNKVKHQDTR